MKSTLNTICAIGLTCLMCLGVGCSDASAQTLDPATQTQFDVETGPVVTGRNDVRIPGRGGTLFSLKDDLSTKPKAHVRLRLIHTANKVHTPSLLYAPLRIISEGIIDRDVRYNGTTFPAGTPLAATYQFNSYRLTYRYNWIHNSSLIVGLGVTAKIRDANITVASSKTSVDRPSFGLVPLPNFHFRWTPTRRWGFLFEGDAYAGPGGRAIDTQLVATHALSDNWNIRSGYRVLDGGAGNQRVYGFARFHYGVVGITYTM